MSQALSAVAPVDDETSLLGMVIVLLQRKRLIIGTTVAVGLAALGISLALPNVYEAGTSLLPPQQPQSGAAAMLSQLGGLAGPVAGVSGLKNPNDLYIGMLKSRTVADRIITRFDLKKVYQIASQDLARAQLAANTDISSGKDGLIVIQVQDRDQQRVAELANAYAGELLKLTTSLAVTEAAQRRVFYEQQLVLAKDNLAKAEAALKGRIAAKGVISVESESRGVLETVARLKAQISVKQIELNSMKAFFTSSHPDFKRAEEDLSSLQRELANLENGSKAAGDGGAGAQNGLENIQRLRDLKYFQTIYELMARQYEIARIDEAKNPGIVQVLDTAVAPEHKAKPKRAIIVLSATFGAFALACLWALLADAAARAATTPTVGAQYEQARRLLRLRR